MFVVFFFFFLTLLLFMNHQQLLLTENMRCLSQKQLASLDFKRLFQSVFDSNLFLD